MLVLRRLLAPLKDQKEGGEGEEEGEGLRPDLHHTLHHIIILFATAAAGNSAAAVSR